MQADGAVLVTGGSGFLGSAVVKALLRCGYRVHTLQRKGGPQVAGAVHHVGDIQNAADVTRALDGIPYVIHAAGLAHVFRPSAASPFHEVNELGTDVVVRAAVAAGVRHVVHVSSVSVYGSSGAEGRESSPIRPEGPYATSKAAAEARATAAVQGSTTRLTILRLATLYGPGDRGNVQRLVDAIAAGRFIWLGQGSNRKSLIYVDDAAEACVVALGSTRPGVEVFNVSSPPVRMDDIVSSVAAALGRRAPRWYVPAMVANAAGVVAAAAFGARGRALRATLTKWLNDDVYPGDEFVRRFAFQPRVTLREGIARQVGARTDAAAAQ